MISGQYSKTAALFLSTAFSPPLVVCYGAALIALSPVSAGGFTWAALIVAVFVLPPVFYVLFLMRSGAVSGFHMSKRGERARPLKFMVINTSAGILLFNYLEGPTLLVDVALACLMSLLAVFAVTLYYKISAHSAAVSSLWVLVVMLFQGTVFPLLFPVFLFLVSWSRVRLSLHTLAQTVTGCLLGSCITFTVLAIEGYFNFIGYF